MDRFNRLTQFAVLTLVFALTGATVAVATDWTQYEFDAAHSGFNRAEATLNASNVDQVHLAVRARTRRSSSDITQPAVANGMAFVARGDRLYAVRAATGSRRWSARSCGGSDSTMPVIAAGAVWVRSDGGELTGFDLATGTKVYCNVFPPSTGTASVANKVLYLPGVNGVLVAFDASSRSVRWKVSLPTRLDLMTPAISGGHAYILTSINDRLRQFLYKIRTSDGTLVWARRLGVRSFDPPVVGEGSVFVGGVKALLAVDPATGAMVWRRKLWGEFTGPAIAHGTLYAGTGEYPEGGLAALDATTGALLWHHNSGLLGRPPTLANGVVFAMVAVHSHLGMYDAADGSLLAERYCTNDPLAYCNSSEGVTVVNGVFYATTPNADYLDGWHL